MALPRSARNGSGVALFDYLLGVGTAGVDGERKTRRARSLAMCPKYLLASPRAVFIAEVEAGSPIPTTLGCSAFRGRIISATVSSSEAASCRWMPTEHQLSGSDFAIANTAWNSVILVPMVDHGADPCPPRDHPGAFGSRWQKIQVAMVVDEHCLWLCTRLWAGLLSRRRSLVTLRNVRHP